MPSPIAAIDLIARAMRKIGVLASGEVPNADEATDGLAALNNVLETWSLESMAVYGNLPEPFLTVAGQATYTLGTGGDWNTDRPEIVNGIYVTVDGVDFPLGQWTIGEYNAQPVKYQQNAIPERFVFINDAPFAQVILYPTPQRAVTITVDAPRILTQIPTIATVITLPPTYVRALEYAVGEELAPEYGAPIDVSARARATKAVIKRANRVSPVSGFDATLLRRGNNSRSWWGI